MFFFFFFTAFTNILPFPTATFYGIIINMDLIKKDKALFSRKLEEMFLILKHT